MNSTTGPRPYHSPRSILCAGNRAIALTSSRRLLCPKPITSSSALASLFATPAKVWLPYLLLSSGTAFHTFPSTRVVPIATADTGRKAVDHLTVVTPDVLCLLHREDRFKDREFGALAVGHSDVAELWSPHSHSPRSILCAGNRAIALTSSRRLLCPKPITSSSALASLFATPAKVWLPYLLLSSGTAFHTFPSTRVVPIATADTGRKAVDHLTVVTPDVLCLLHREDRFKDREFGALAVGHSNKTLCGSTIKAVD
ncbi:hypothetical protein ZIOFF_014346 [Zingiber officinale]|uniref:Uncharacterized protein n=1 Tax=Zingiber officinale TaxID=94328 RepID=A0A8J5I0G4_ZINOF|nr:hypothetical protein ZIOFF_014346 [Zingiber officinale]